MKTRPTQKFWPLQKQILPPLELRSSCGIDMCVKKTVPHQPEASPHVTGLHTGHHIVLRPLFGFGTAVL